MFAMKLLTLITCVLIATIISSTSFAQQKQKQKDDKAKEKTRAGNTNIVQMQMVSPLDTTVIETIMGMKGKLSKGEYKLTIPQNDLSVEVDGFKIIPAMGLSSWVAFTPSTNGAMIMGDLILTETDLKPVQREVINQGLTITAIHNHFIRNHPNVVYMHIRGMGKTEQMATKAKAVLNKISEVRGGDPSKGKASIEAVSNTIDLAKLDLTLGYKGEMSKGVYKYTIGRPDVQLREHGIPITTFMGFNTWAAFQGSDDHAAVCGDFTMTEDEVAPVVSTLAQNGIEVVALHNHMVHEQPRIFFLHYWGTGNAQDLAKALRAALDQTGKKKNHVQEMNMNH